MLAGEGIIDFPNHLAYGRYFAIAIFIYYKRICPAGLVAPQWELSGQSQAFTVNNTNILEHHPAHVAALTQ